MYWKTDLHWTTVGGAAVRQGACQRGSTRGWADGSGSATAPRPGSDCSPSTPAADVPETASAGDSRRKGQGSQRQGHATLVRLPEFTYYNSWVSSPAKLTWPGRTLLLGDSFMWYALENLRPIFQPRRVHLVRRRRRRQVPGQRDQEGRHGGDRGLPVVTPGTPLAPAPRSDDTSKQS